MEKNIILAVVLSVVVLVIYNIFFMPKPSVKQEAPSTSQEEVVMEKQEAEKPKAPEGKSIILENANIKLTVNTEGGKITSWYIKDKKLELLGKGKTTFNFYLSMPENMFFDFSQTNFKIEGKENNKKLVLNWEDTDKNIKVVETIRLPEQGYHIFFNLSIERPEYTQCYLTFPAKLGEKTGDEERLAFWKGKLYKEREQGVKSEYREGIKWLGVRGKDSIAIIAPISRVQKGFFKIDSWGFVTTERNTSWVIYAGPKTYTYVRLVNNFLKETLGEDHHLTDALDIGFWGYLSVGLQKLLILFYSFTGSYGIAIILLTLLIYGVLSPLTFKQFESMQKMQAVQPELRAIQKKFKNEPRKMQAEMMKIYSKHKINPMSGCLPMFIQLPIIFILYRALLNFPFAENPSFLWIKNLGKPDIPLLLALAGCMFLQQKISQKMQTGADQAGIAKMMQFFPFFLIFILWSLPSGVMLYWFTSTLISTAQQFFIRKKATSVQG